MPFVLLRNKDNMPIPIRYYFKEKPKFLWESYKPDRNAPYQSLISVLELTDEDEFDPKDIPEETELIRIYTDYDSYKVSLWFLKTLDSMPDHIYEQDLARYNEKLEEYNKEVQQWEQEKKVWEEKVVNIELKEYQRLKEKYGDL